MSIDWSRREWLVGSAAALHAGAAPVKVRMWDTVEITLRASGKHANPFTDAGVWVDLEGPGFAERVYGFWDGGTVFRVRVMANAPGMWRWRSGSLPEDRGLSGKQGSFEAAASTDAEQQANPNRRGPLRVAPNHGRHFVYADGTPFFLLADTLWAGNTARCGFSAKQRRGPFAEHLADRRQKGFTAILMQMIHGYGDYPKAQAHRNEGGYALVDHNPSQLNPPFFQALDGRMRELWNQGWVVAAPVIWWGKTDRCIFKPEDAVRIAGYVAARYGTCNVIWCVSGEYQYTFADCGWTAPDLTAIGEAIQRSNPWRHPVSIHPSGRTRWPAPHAVQSSKPFHGQSWIDHHWLQTGQEVNLVPNIVTRLEENRALIPAMPVFCSESSYELASDAESGYHARWQAWAAMLNGAAGYGYGAHGIWQCLDPADPKGEPGKLTGPKALPRREAIRLPGSAQVGHVRTLLQPLGWPALEPRREAIQVNGMPNALPTASDLTPPQAARLGDTTWVIYVPRGNAGRALTISGIGNEWASSAATAQWFDPRKGEYHGLPQGWSPDNLPARPEPTDEDWVCVLRRRRSG